MYLGKYIFIYNDTDTKLTDLCFIYPNVQTISNVKKCPAHAHVQELITDMNYKGMIDFFFRDEPDQVYSFKFQKPGVNVYVGQVGKDTYNMYVKVVEQDGKRTLVEDTTRDYYQD